MKSILLMVHDDAGQESRLQCALDVARAVDGRLVCLDLLHLPVVIDAYGGVGQAMLISDEREHEDAHIARLDKRLALEDVPHEWLRMQGAFDVALADSARLCDLVVVSRDGVPELGDDSGLAGRLARIGDVPVLAVPPEQKRLDLFGKAVVGWDGSATADAAIRAAAPLLALAESVELLTVGTPAGQDQAEDVAAYLARHDCHVDVRQISAPESVADQLLAALSAPGVAWGVIGAYGHSPMRERLFGGVTRTLLAKSPVPLLIAH